MFSFPTFPSISSIFQTKGPKIIGVESVRVHNIETEKDKRGRSLKHLLKLNHASHAILYHGLQFHNHLPHILGSAYLFGSEIDHLESIYDKEAEELEKWKASPGEVSEHDWRDFLGDRRYQRAFVDFFEDELVQNGYDWRKVVNKYLLGGDAPLINNIVSGLGHPMIHLGYAIELDSKEIAIEALGLAATCYNFMHKYLDDPAYSKVASTESSSLLEILETVRKDSRFDNVFDGSDSADMETLFQEREELVLEYWNSWDINEPTKQFQDSQFAATCLVSATAGPGHQTHDFFLVHTLTSSHATRIILPFIPSERHIPLVRQWWLFTLAVYITQSRPKIDTKSISDYHLDGRDWTWVDRTAIQSEWSHDAHYVKALRAMKEAANTWGDENSFFLRAAAKFADQFSGWFGM